MDSMDRFNDWKQRASDKEVCAQLVALEEQGEDAIVDAFYQDLEFGTAGLRGILGAGTNRMNIYTVGKATQGLANYLNATFDKPTVAMARDSRNNGELFTHVAAGILAANGITSYIYERIEPVPSLSFAVRDRACSAGICMTASHNPAEYNGYKVYGSDGCQITSEAAASIQSAINDIDVFDDVKHLEFEAGMQAGYINWMNEGVLDRFIEAVKSESVCRPQDSRVDLSVVYTPLNGSGLECVTRILHKVGIDNIIIPDEQRFPNGDFPTCPYPNPEIREALDVAIKTCEQVHPDLLLATDPDADRVGIAVKDNNDYVLLTGNETGILLLDYIARIRSELGVLPEKPVAVSTIVSTVMIGAIAQHYGIELRRVLTGFKYIGEQIALLESDGEVERFIFGFEESYGYLSGPHVRDKDGINASMLICQMTRYYKSLGMNLAQAMDALYQEYGYYRNRTISISYPGESGSQKMADIMSSLRADDVSSRSIGGFPIESIVDYAKGIEHLPKADVIEFQLPDTNKLIIRPSGTEPKIKAYMFAKASTDEAAYEILDKLEKSARELLG